MGGHVFKNAHGTATVVGAVKEIRSVLRKSD